MAGYFETHWYKDLMDVYRLKDIEGPIDKQEWVKEYEKIPCKVYSTAQSTLHTDRTSGTVEENNKIAYANKYTLQEGDEIRVWQYGDNYGTNSYDRYIVGKPKKYKEPFGGVKVGLEHSQATITLKERVNNTI